MGSTLMYCSVSLNLRHLDSKKLICCTSKSLFSGTGENPLLSPQKHFALGCSNPISTYIKAQDAEGAESKPPSLLTASAVSISATLRTGWTTAVFACCSKNLTSMLPYSRPRFLSWTAINKTSSVGDTVGSPHPKRRDNGTEKVCQIHDI